MDNNPIIQQDTHIREAASEVQQNHIDEKAKSFLRGYFKNKSYFRKYWILMCILFFFTLVENTVSGFTGYNYTYNLVSSFADPYYAIVFAVIILLALELLKQVLALSFFKNWNKDGFSPGMAIALAIVTAVSIFFTVKGSESVVWNYSKSPALVNTDSIAKYYDNQIRIKNDDVAFQEGLSLSEKENWIIINVTMPDLQGDIDTLTNRRDIALAKAEKTNDRLLSEFTGKKTITASTVKNGAWIFNIATLFCQYFLGLMLYRSGVNYDVLDGQKADENKKQGTPAEVNTHYSDEETYSGYQDHSAGIAVNQRPIGFQIPEKQAGKNDFQAETEIAGYGEFREFQPNPKPENMNFRVMHTNTLVTLCRNSYRRAETNKRKADKDRNRRIFKQVSTHLESLGYQVDKISKTGLSIKEPKA